MKDHLVSGLSGLTASQLCERAGVKPQWSQPSRLDPCRDCIFLALSQSLRNVLHYLKNRLHRVFREES